MMVARAPAPMTAMIVGVNSDCSRRIGFPISFAVRIPSGVAEFLAPVNDNFIAQLRDFDERFAFGARAFLTRELLADRESFEASGQVTWIDIRWLVIEGGNWQWRKQAASLTDMSALSRLTAILAAWGHALNVHESGEEITSFVVRFLAVK